METFLLSLAWPQAIWVPTSSFVLLLLNAVAESKDAVNVTFEGLEQSIIELYIMQADKIGRAFMILIYNGKKLVKRVG